MSIKRTSKEFSFFVLVFFFVTNSYTLLIRNFGCVFQFSFDHQQRYRGTDIFMPPSVCVLVCVCVCLCMCVPVKLRVRSYICAASIIIFTNKFAQRKRVIRNLEMREWAQVFYVGAPFSLSLPFQFGKMSLICKHRHQITSRTGHANFVIGNEKLVCRMGNLGSAYFTLIYRRTVNVINYSFR